jgi:hypothetical protein
MKLYMGAELGNSFDAAKHVLCRTDDFDPAGIE